MLKKIKRLSREEFSRFFSVGKRLHSPTAQLIYTKQPKMRVAVVVPKKVLPKAVQRNKLRRRVYTIMQEIDRVGVFIFILKTPASKQTFQELRKEIIGLVTQATNARQHTQ